MDIRKLIKESVFGAPMAYEHLDSLHIGILRKIATGNFNADMVSGKVLAVLDDLVSYGLVTDYDYEITADGQRALRYADHLGGSVDRRQAVAKKDLKPDEHKDYFEID